MEFRSIQDIWREKKRSWDKLTLDRLVSALEDNVLEGMWKRLCMFAWIESGVRLDRTSKEEAEGALLKFIVEKCKLVSRPKSFIELARRTCKAAWLEQEGNPFESEAISRLIKRTVIVKTKAPKAHKGVLPITSFLVRLWAKYGDPEQYDIELLRTITFMVLCMARMQRISCMYRINRDEVSLKGERALVLPIMGDKMDKGMNGSIITVFATKEGNPFDPIKLWTRYEERTRKQAEAFRENKSMYLEKLARKGKKGREYALVARNMTPMFFTKSTADFYQQTSMETLIRLLLRELGFTKDSLNRTITPGSLRKSARMAARRQGYEEALLDAISGWKQKTVPRAHYKDYVVPNKTSDVIFNTEALLKTISRKREDIPHNFKLEEEWLFETRS